MSPDQINSSSQCPGSKDGSGAGDHDEPYRFGRKPRVDVTFPFSERQYARLLALRSRYYSRRFERRWRDAA
jgi:hypothetical protein